MQSKRVTYLMGVLVILILGFVTKPFWETHLESPANPASTTISRPTPPIPLTGNNSIADAKVTQNEHGQWFVDFSYFYTGAPLNAIVLLDYRTSSDPKKFESLPQGNDVLLAKRGHHQARREIFRPAVNAAVTASGIRVRLLHPHSQNSDLAEQIVPVEISWPDEQTAQILQDLRTQTPDEYLATAVGLIDAGTKSGLAQARRRLDYLLQKQPQFHPGYLELARVTMKTNWGPEGLRQAESYIDAARKLSPEDPNVWILQGYVYTYQGRYKEAESLFAASSKTETPNLWLWTNWGELFKLQGKLPQAIQMFQKALDQPPPGNTYDKARHQAYWHLLDLFLQQSKWEQSEALHEQRFREYPSNTCFGLELARFMVMRRGNAARAIEIGTQLETRNCSSFDVKETLGLAHYLQWVNAPAAEQDLLLNRARIYFPTSARLTYMLASSEYTEKALKRLLSAGEAIDQTDNQKMTALAYAMSNKKHDIAGRLLKLRARPDIPVGATDVPLALMPVIEEDYPGIKLMRQFGVDYAKIKYQNMTAIEHAKRMGNRKLLEAVADAGQHL